MGIAAAVGEEEGIVDEGVMVALVTEVDVLNMESLMFPNTFILTLIES